MNLIPNIKATIAYVNKWNYIKLKSFCTAKKTTKYLPTEWEKITANHIPDKRVIAKIYENSYNSIAKTNGKH